MRKTIFAFVVAMMMVLGMGSQAQEAADNLVRNGELITKAGKRAPMKWHTSGGIELKGGKEGAPEGVGNVIRVKVKKEHPTLQGYIQQKIRDLNPEGRYRVPAMMKSSIPGLAFVQIKLIKDGKTFQRLNTRWSKESWRTVSKEFSADGADTLLLLLRWKQTESAYDESILFADVKLISLTK